ncbi:DNA polymerase III subunit psi [Candidatus Hartigia pinicola]|nr:DNA polymerase III subunit psi [Candidatus Hartigia pinicola]
MTRRDRLLNQLGITQWIVRNPYLLNIKKHLIIPEFTKLIIISDENINSNDSLLNDILFLMKIHQSEVFYINSKKLAMIPVPIKIMCWVLSNNSQIKKSENFFISPILSELYVKKSAKISLWKQICKYNEK